MNNFFIRIISAIIYAALFIFSILFSKESYVGLLTVFSGICIWEFSRIVQSKTVLLLIPVFISTIFLFFFKVIDTDVLFYFLVFCILHSLYLIIDLYSKSYTVRNTVVKFFTSFNYILLPFLFLIFLPFIKGIYEPNVIIYVILIIWTNDSFAYLVGKNYGKHKLFERISPKKTIEGFIGGLLFSIMVGLLIGKYSRLFTMLDWAIIATLVSIFGTFGDLVESKFKRQANVKDSGKIMPGHGGLLDRLDSLFFLAPFVYLYIHYCI